jgi:hypothetical protein
MLRIKDFLFAFLLRLPFYLVVYIWSFILTQGQTAFFPLLAILTLLCVLESLLTRKSIFIVLCVVLCVVFLLLRMPAAAAAALCAVLYRPSAYSGFISAVWIAFLCLSAVIVELLIDPSLSYICIRCVLTAAVAAVLARQMQTLSRFLGSYYCRQVSRRTASAMVKRSIALSAASLAGLIVTGFLIRPSGLVVIPLPDLTIDPDRAAAFSELTADRTRPEIEDAVTGEIVPPPEPDAPFGERAPQPPRLIPMLLIAAAVLTVFIIIVLLDRFARRPELLFEDFDEAVAEEPAVPGIRTKRRGKLLHFGPNHTVRRLFKAKVREHKLTPKKSDTPKRLTDTMGESEDVETLRRLYHKARYSGADVKRSELNALYAERGKR